MNYQLFVLRCAPSELAAMLSPRSPVSQPRFSSASSSAMLRCNGLNYINDVRLAGSKSHMSVDIGAIQPYSSQVSGVTSCFTLGPRCAEAMLARSAATPISMSFFCPALERSSSFSSLISEHLHHTRDLQVMGTGTANVRPFVYGLPSPSAVLEGLDISLIDTPGEEEGDNFELPGVITGSRLPSLRRVTLDGFWMPWSAPILGGLTHLHIQLHKPRRHALDAYLNASHEELFSVLKTLRALESLILINCLPSGHWADRNDEVLRLPRLEMLQLQGPSAACFGIAKRLRIRSRCQMQLRCTDDTDVAEILPFLSALTSGGADLSPWHTLLLTHDIDTGFRLQMWRLCNAPRTDDESEDEFELEPLDVDLAISSCSPGQSYGPLQRLCRVLPLETIRTIHVSIDTFGYNVPARDWIDMLWQCSETTRVWVRNRQAISFCEALSMTTDTHPRPLAELDLDVRMPGEPFLWNLETLKLSNVDLGMQGYMRGY
ncbi:hypothetical protein EWM64_g7479 [Hericium alpestre]|uniref:F-box domain-containing protein n=1 Tax=Hericium alpestre TaxID=135208 RepID=A0A4Y9ZNT9_9AGAM|nr:hypothetical protein EWM64_g7479 [Hericium alpestre]